MSAQNLQTVPCAFLARRLVVPACQACDSKIAQSSLAELGFGVAGTARYCSLSRLPARGRLVGRDGIVAEAFGNARVENASSSARAVGVQEVRRRGRCRARSSPTFPENASKSGNSAAVAALCVAALCVMGVAAAMALGIIVPRRASGGSADSLQPGQAAPANQPAASWSKEARDAKPKSQYSRRMKTDLIEKSIARYVGLDISLSGYDSGNGNYYERDGYTFHAVDLRLLRRVGPPHRRTHRRDVHHPRKLPENCCEQRIVRGPSRSVCRDGFRRARQRMMAFRGLGNRSRNTGNHRDKESTLSPCSNGVINKPPSCEMGRRRNMHPRPSKPRYALAATSHGPSCPSSFSRRSSCLVSWSEPNQKARSSSAQHRLSQICSEATL